MSFSEQLELGIGLAAALTILVALIYSFVRSPASAEHQSVTTRGGDRHTSDLLEQAEVVELTNLADESKSNKTQIGETAISESDSSKLRESQISWVEGGPHYRPASIDPKDLFARVGLPIVPHLTRAKHHVLIQSAALDRIVEHLCSNTKVELGGLLVGVPYYAPTLDNYIVVIFDGYEADGGIETAVSFEYTAQTWSVMTPKLQSMPAEYVVVGSYHSHPNLGVFLSTTDIDTQVSVFPLEWQVALVIDPVRKITGFFISQAGVPIKYDLFD